MEGEIFRRQYEPLMYKYGVDIVMNGHFHAYERSFPVYNNTVNTCGITHLVLGDGGNYENAYVPWITPQAPWSAFREASFGVASLNVMSATQVRRLCLKWYHLLHSHLPQLTFIDHDVIIIAGELYLAPSRMRRVERLS
jgi:hypothetical protein